MRAVILAMLGAGMFTTSASADWQYAKWRMTAPQIVSASKGDAHEYHPGEDFVCASTGLKVMAVVPRKVIAGVPFQVAFCSTGNGRLSSVSLDGVAANYAALKRALLSQYGAPVSDGPRTVVWNDRRSANTVTLINVADVASRIEYRPIGGSGL